MPLGKIVDILFEDGPDDQRYAGEDEVEKRDVHVFEEGLTGVTAVEGEDELGEGEQHVFVEEVEDHLCNADVVPSTVDQQQAPEHAEFRKGVVWSLHCTHAFLPEQPNADMCCFDHGDVVGPIANS